MQPVPFLLELGKLSKEFALIAKRVGQKIIEEIHLPSRQRTIHPVVLGIKICARLIIKFTCILLIRRHRRRHKVHLRRDLL